MALVTPGAIMKLLQSMSTSSDARGLGEHHRSAVVQIIGIVPAASLSPDDGFYLQLSDSLNSTYVLPPPNSPADSFRLGHLLHLDRLHPSHPVPTALSLKPVLSPHRSPPPILGSPEPLLALCSASDPNSFIIQHSSALPPSPTNLTRRVNNPPPPPAAVAKRRFSSPAAPSRTRPASPVVAKRASSPVPSKCVVPGLAQAKEENRKGAREPAIVVPSRYRQPSPGASGGGRRGSVSPAARRLSRGGSSPAGSGGEKRRTGVVVAGISRASDAIVGSGRSVRKSWDDSGGSGGSGDAKEKGGGGGTRSKVDQQSILRTQVAISRRLSDATKELNVIEEASTNDVKQKPSSKIEPSSIPDQKQNSIPTKVHVHDRKWTDGSVPFDTVSDSLARLGKEALQRRNVASVAAAEALEEALATESIIRSLSMFSDLCTSSKAGNPLPTIELFLSIYNDLVKWTAVAGALAASRGSSAPNEEATVALGRTRPASLWVEAALATDLEVLSLVNGKLSENVSLPSAADAPRASLLLLLSRKNSLVAPPAARSQSKVPVGGWTRGQGVGETMTLASSLRREMQSWFLKFVEDALDVGFRMFSDVLEEDGRDNGKVAAVLSRLKRVNDWLDGVGRKPEEDMVGVVEKIERLKRKIYGFVITHVGSAFDSSVSLKA